MNALDYVIAAALIAGLAIAVYLGVRSSKSGGCCGDCSKCGKNDGCEKDRPR